MLIGTTYFLKNEEYYEYGGFLWYPKHCLWLQPSFDLLIVPNRAQSCTFLLESPKLTEIKYIYYGWKKGCITEENYQRYTAKTADEAITPAKGLVHKITNIVVPDPKENRFLEFIKK
jgi:hypothetical protein